MTHPSDPAAQAAQAANAPSASAGRRALLLLNKRARNGALPLDEVLALLAEHGIDPVEPEGGSGPDCSDMIRKHAGEVDMVIVGGGDGSMNSAARGLIETGLPLGILPLGTANDLARTLSIPTDPLEAARIIGEGRTRRIDLGEVNGHPFFNVASIGFSVKLARELTSEAKKRWGTLGYAIAGLRVLRQIRPYTVNIEHDGRQERVKTIQVSVGNGRFYGGGMTVEETAQPDDGRLDVYSLEVQDWYRLLRLLPSLRKGTQGSWPDVRSFATTEVTLRTRRRHDVNADGELLTSTPAHFRLLRKALSVYVPAEDRS